MMPSDRSTKLFSISFVLILLISAAVKIYASQMLAWEVDYVPIVARGQAWLDGGAFPAVGTLSSVAAFNMPFLVWMQIPALLFTRDVRIVLVCTQLIFNLLGTWVVFRLGSRIFDRRAGLAAAVLFTFSEVGISSAYTAWAQLLMPGFYVMVAYLLFLWKSENRAWQVALTWMLATAAFMTHFSSVFLFAVIVIISFVMRLPLNRRGLLAGVVGSVIMLAPYLVYESGVDFVDLKAFFTRRSTISAEVLAEYAHLKPEAQARSADEAEAQTSTGAEEAGSASAPLSRLERGIVWVLSIPLQLFESLRLVFSTDLLQLRQHHPVLHGISAALRVLLEASFWFGIVHAGYRCFSNWRGRYLALRAEQRGFQHGWRLAQDTLVDSAAGRNLVLLVIILAVVAGLILVRAGPEAQASYYTGLVSLQLLMCAYGITCIADKRELGILVAALVLLFVSLGAFDRYERVSNHDPTQHSPLNLALYDHVNGATSWIASDWSGEESIIVSYDMMPEMANQWWVVAWHRVDESYRVGMAFDYLLESYFDLENSNRNPLGIADSPDYIVTSAPGLERYVRERYQLRQFGALFVLKPR